MFITLFQLPKILLLLLLFSLLFGFNSNFVLQILEFRGDSEECCLVLSLYLQKFIVSVVPSKTFNKSFLEAVQLLEILFAAN